MRFLKITVVSSQNVNILLYQRFKRIAHFGGQCVFCFDPDFLEVHKFRKLIGSFLRRI